MLCTSCGRNNSDYALTCSKCGASLKKRGDVQKPVRDLSRPIAQSQLQSTASETYQNDINRVMPGESKVEPVNSFTNKISQDSLESIDSLNDHKDYHNKTQSIFPENLPEIDMGNMDVENKDISQFSDYKIVSNIPDTSYSNKTGNDKIQAVFTRIEEVFESLWHDIKGVFDSLNNSNQQKKQNLHTLAHESVADDSDDWHVKIDDETGFSDNPKTKAVHIEHEYHKLGGWLAFLAYGLLVGAVWVLVIAISGFLSFMALSHYFGKYFVFLAFFNLAAFCPVVWCCYNLFHLIKEKNPSFLRFYETAVIILSSALILVCALTGFKNIGEMISALLNELILFAIWTTYIRKSVRVRTYFGTDEYLKRSLFFKNCVAPPPADVIYETEEKADE